MTGMYLITIIIIIILFLNIYMLDFYFMETSFTLHSKRIQILIIFIAR